MYRTHVLFYQMFIIVEYINECHMPGFQRNEVMDTNDENVISEILVMVYGA